MDPVLTQPRQSSPAVRLMLLLIVYAIPLLGAVRARLDADLWWHLRAGQWIVDHGTVTSTDPFSQYGADKPWLAYSWLFEVVLYGLYEKFDVYGVVLFRSVLALLVTACCHWLVARREPRFFVATILLAVAMVPLLPLISERPWLFTIVGSALTLLAILELREGRDSRLVWLLPLVFVLWANIHIQFIYGLILLGIGCFAPLVERGFGPDALRNWNKLFFLSVLCALATLVNPYHVRVYFVVIEYATQGAPFAIVEELKAMRFRETGDWLVLGMALGTAFVLGRKGKLSTFEVLLFLMAAILSFRARRDIWLLVLAMLVIVPGWGVNAATRPEPFPLTWRRWAVVVLGEGLILTALLVRPGFRTELAQAEEKQYPRKAVEEVRKGLAAGEVRGPLYNTFSWGGYLIWRLPELPVSMDGRTNLHGEERLRRSYLVWNGNADWRNPEKEPDLAGANVIILDRQSALTELLRLDKEHYAIYHEDEQAVVFTRRATDEKR